MPLGRGDHAKVAASLSGYSDDDLAQLKSEFEEIFAEIEIRKSSGLEPGYSKKEIEVCIEGYVKIDAKQKGKGWWHRAKLRSQLVMKLT